jgi:hypothetical protein
VHQATTFDVLAQASKNVNAKKMRLRVAYVRKVFVDGKKMIRPRLELETFSELTGVRLT